MLRSLFTGISGLSAHQKMLDVTSNNIANVNTTGYKANASVFEDTLSQTLSGASAPNTAGTIGGTSPMQIGLGVKFASTSTNFNEGSAQSTGRASDMIINGDGFFVIKRDGQQLYTRAGSFSLDSVGHMVAPDGAILQDSTGNALDLSALGTGQYVSWSIDSAGVVNAVDANGASTPLG